MSRRRRSATAASVLVSDQGGSSNVLAELERIGMTVDKNDPRIARLLDEVKEREALGYAYEAADASFELLARRVLGKVPDYFDVEQFDVNVEQRYNALGKRVTVAMAVVKVKVGGETLISAGEGNGPVNALDVALRKDLGKYQKYIEGLKLTDYRVRILNAGTEAVTRVLIESEDENGERWTTVGVSPNIIDASFQALMDSIVYKLVRSGANRHDRSRLHPGARSSARIARSTKPCSRTLGYAKLETRPATIAFGKRYSEFWLNHRPGMTPRQRRQRRACRAACGKPRERSMPFMRRRLQPGGMSDGAPGLRPHTRRRLLRGLYPRSGRQPDRSGDVSEMSGSRAAPAVACIPSASRPRRTGRAASTASAGCPRRVRPPAGSPTVRADEGELAHVVEQRAERIPEAADIGDQDRLLVTAELRPGELLDQFLQRADAARQGHEGVGALEHDALSLMHVARDDQFLRVARAAARGRSGIPG